MFLDDELFEMCKQEEVLTPEDVQELNVEICTKCEFYYKNNLKIGMLKSETKTVLDKTFNLFDSFVRMLKESNDGKLIPLGELFEKHTFKKQFLANKEVAEIYNDL